MFEECYSCEDKIKCALQKKEDFGEENLCYRFFSNYDRVENIVNNYIYNVKLPVDDFRINSFWAEIEEKLREVLETSLGRPFIKVMFRPEQNGEVTVFVYVSCGRISRVWQNTYQPDEEEDIHV